MKLTTENMENRQIALNIEAEASELDKSLNEAYRHLVNKVSIPGFRRGKAPRAILEQHVGRRAMLEEAMEHLIPELYEQAIKSQELEPIAMPQIEITQTEPVVFKAVVPLKPTIELGDYHSIRLESKPVEIGDEEIQAVISRIQQQQAVLAPVDRPVQLGDLLTINVEAQIEGKPFLSHKDILYDVDENSPWPMPGFALNLVGIKKNEQKTFSLVVPANYAIKGFQGKECSFTVTVTEIKEKQLPELTDEFARSCNYDDLGSMKEKVAADLRAKAEAVSRMELKQKALDAIVEISKVEYPPILEDREINRLLEDEAGRFGFRELAEYLKRANKTEEELRQEWRPIARKRVTNSLVLEKIAEEEKIEISSSEVDNKVKEIVEGSADKEKMQQFLALPQVRESIEQSLRTDKTGERLMQIVEGRTKEE